MGFLRGNLPPLVLTGRNNTWQKVNTWTESHCCRKVALAPLARGSKSRGPSLFCNVQLFYCSFQLDAARRGVRGQGYGKNYDKLYGYCWMPTSIPDNRTCDVTGAIDLLCLNNLYRGLMSVKGSLTTVQRWHTASIKCFRKGNNFDDKFCMLSSALGNPKVGVGGGVLM